jgi:hypothetical protein
MVLIHIPFLSATEWQPIGPAPTLTPGEIQGLGARTGRIDVAAPDPVDPDVMYLGGSGGGVWKTSTWNRASEDGGPIWLPLTDDQPSLDFSGYHSLTISTAQDRKVILAAVSGPGAGVIRSANGGLSWQLLGNSTFEGAKGSIGSIVAHPTDSDILYVSVRSGGPGGGVYKSEDAGPGKFCSKHRSSAATSFSITMATGIRTLAMKDWVARPSICM